MAKQVQVTVDAINGSPINTPITTSYPTANILVQAFTDDNFPNVNAKILYYFNTLNQLQFNEILVEESVTDIGTAAGGDMFAATVWQINGESQKAALDSLFPSIQPSIDEASDPIQTLIQSVVYFKGIAYYCEETEDDLVTAANLGGGGSGYKVYTFLFQQAGTSDPNPIELQNTIGAIVWARQSTGQYFATLAGAFPHDKTWLPYASDFNGNGEILITLTDDTSVIGYATFGWGNTDRLGFNVYNPSWVRKDWSELMDVSNIGLEVRVYN